MLTFPSDVHKITIQVLLLIHTLLHVNSQNYWQVFAKS